MNKETLEAKIKELLSNNPLFSGATIKINYKHKKDKSKSHTKEIIINSKI